MTRLINEAKIERKRIFIILGIVLASILIFAVILRVAKNRNALPVSDIALCDQNPSELCVVTIGANGPDSMVINFQLSEEDYPVFHVKGSNRGVSYDYSCYTTDDVLTSVYCKGPRTPLGEYIELEVYSVDENVLLAQGKVFVAAVVVWTPVSITATPAISGTPGTAAATSGTGTAATQAQVSGTPSPTRTVRPIPTQTRVTPTPATAYPNPSHPTGTAYPNP